MIIGIFMVQYDVWSPAVIGVDLRLKFNYRDMKWQRILKPHGIAA